MMPSLILSLIIILLGVLFSLKSFLAKILALILVSPFFYIIYIFKDFPNASYSSKSALYGCAVVAILFLVGSLNAFGKRPFIIATACVYGTAALLGLIAYVNEGPF